MPTGILDSRNLLVRDSARARVDTEAFRGLVAPSPVLST